MVMLDMDEYRLQDGWSRDGKKGPTVWADSRPQHETIDLNKPGDYTALPRSVPGVYRRRAVGGFKIPRRRATEICNVLYNIGAIIRTGKAAFV